VNLSSVIICSIALWIKDFKTSGEAREGIERSIEEGTQDGLRARVCKATGGS
jgi:hypothetical protein